ncbi:sugar ABC transporter permease [Clavibacter sp. MX14-G9D]|uniref:carbohydrate ABC transporter permease n=1 Tax=Clavibacter sp. MX14-G9D TaxID=3064656 RepID=UPI00293EC24E|nr:sugar ABC transporter permease [Clavibacter sp. MX14-G9D]
MTAAPGVRTGTPARTPGTTPAGAGRADRPPHRRRTRSRGEAAVAWMLLTPNLLLLGLFVLVPLVWAVFVSLQRTDGFGGGTFTGLDNYQRLVSDPVFWRSAANTVLFTVIVTPLSMGLGLGAAVLLDSVLPARGLFRSILILPMAISGVATALIGVLLFDENSGLIDKLVRAVGLPGVPWQSDGTAAFVSIVLITLWWRVGFNMLIYLAGLQSVDAGVYEAGRLDGANGWQRFRYLTVPLVGPSSFFLLILNVIYSFQVFDLVFVMTGGGPGNATSVIVTYAYDQGFVTRDQGYAAAIGVVLLLVMLAFTVVRWYSSRSRDLVD